MMVIALPLLIALVGLVVYGLAEGKLSQVGLATYAAAMVAVVLELAHHVARL
jgi:hypothetical protein